MRAPDGGAGSARRVAGDVLAARTGGLGRHGGTAVIPQPELDYFRSRDRFVLQVILGLSGVGVLIGGCWAWIAPPIHAVAALTKTGERVHDYLGTDSEHFFVAPCLMLGLLTVVAVVAPVLVWQRRAQRGPATAFALAVGLIIGAAAAAGWGAAGPVALRRTGFRRDTAVERPQDRLCRRGAAGVLRAHAAAGGAHRDLAGRHRRAGVCRARGRERARRPRCLRGARIPAAGEPGESGGVTVDGGEPSYR